MLSGVENVRANIKAKSLESRVNVNGAAAIAPRPCKMHTQVHLRLPSVACLFCSVPAPLAPSSIHEDIFGSSAPFETCLMISYHQSMRFDDRVVNGLGVLAAVVKSGNFAVAGKSLNMSQSGVSRAIGRLEARIGIRLLERTTRTVTLGEEGRRLYEQIVPLLSGLQEAAASVATSKDAVRGTLRVNMDPFISQLILGPLLSRFLK